MPLAASPAVVRAADVLHHLAEHPAERFSVSDVARAVGMPRATCDTVLLALLDRRLVWRDERRRYALGPACIGLGDAARAANPVLRAAAAHAERLGRALGACTAVAIRDRDETRIVHAFDFGPLLGIRARVGESVPLVPPFGATFLAWDDEPEVDAWLRRAQPPLSRTEVRRYRAALDAVRGRGFSVTLATERQSSLIEALERLTDDGADEARRARDDAVRDMSHSAYLIGDVADDASVRVAQVSAPVFGPDRTVAAVLMLLGPNHDLTGAQARQVGEQVGRVAAEASADAGGA